MDMKQSTTRFLLVNLVLSTLMCVAIFSALSVLMTRETFSTIRTVGNVYMKSMNKHITDHFETTMNFRQSQLKYIVDLYPPEDMTDRSDMHRIFENSARTYDFSYLALYSEEGNIEVIYGDNVQLFDSISFLKYLRYSEKNFAAGSDSYGNNMVLMGMPAKYKMADGGCSLGIVAGFSVDYLTDKLALGKDDTLVYSYVIRTDGSFVARNTGAYRSTYFKHLTELYGEEKKDEAQEIISGLQNAMSLGQNYSSLLKVGDRWRHIYCTPLPNTVWYLITVMPYGTIDESVGELSTRMIIMSLVSCAVIIGMLIFVFTRYFAFVRQQMRDIEHARQLAMQANRAKSDFLSNMSHDIRTPMNAIVGSTAIALSNMANTQQVKNCLQKISVSSKHLLGLINDILDMSKIESGKMTLNLTHVSLCDIIEVVSSIIRPQTKAKSQTFDVVVHEITTENVWCDSVRMNQIFINLLSNAVKFTPNGGSIRLEIYEEPSPRGEDHVRTHIIVADNGIGMTEEFQLKIFESFAREDNLRVMHTEGSGLGMPIVKYIVDAMGGTIDIKSAPGEGTEFHVVIDLKIEAVENVDMSLPPWKILIIDEDREFCQVTSELIQSLGAKADSIPDGETAAEVVINNHEYGDDYDIILVDWKLPGIDGIETAKRIRKGLGTDIPILLVSAYDWTDIEHEAREAAINGFIAKPLFKSNLYYALKRYMEGGNDLGFNMDDSEDFSGRRVLIAEDNDLNWEVAYELLQDFGMKLERAENGRVCVDKFNLSSPKFYDAILMDLRMPVMNGYEATREIRMSEREDSDIPIIAMTADAFAEDIRKCLECGMNAHIAKPIDIKELARLLKKFMR